MIDVTKFLHFVTAGGRVKRYHTFPTLTTQTDADHSFTVCMLLYILADGLPSANLLLAGLAHDMAEHKYSDVSAHTKHAVPGLSDMLHRLESSALRDNGLEFILSDQELRWLSIADRVEGMLYCIHEFMLGNMYAMLPYNRYLSYLPKEMTLREVELVAAVETMMGEARRGEIVTTYGGE